MNMSDYLEVELRKALFRDSPVTVRANTTAYALGARVMLGTTDLNVYECIVAGTSAGAPPSFTTTLGGLTIDGTVTWMALKQGLPKRPIFVGLHTADPTEAGLGAEVSGGGYARVQYDPGDANWSAPDATGGVTSNLQLITFPAPTAGWGVVTHWSHWDRLAGGNMLIHAALQIAKTINNGDPAPTFPVASLVHTLA